MSTNFPSSSGTGWSNDGPDHVTPTNPLFLGEIVNVVYRSKTRMRSHLGLVIPGAVIPVRVDQQPWGRVDYTEVVPNPKNWPWLRTEGFIFTDELTAIIKAHPKGLRTLNKFVISTDDSADEASEDDHAGPGAKRGRRR